MLLTCSFVSFFFNNKLWNVIDFWCFLVITNHLHWLGFGGMKWLHAIIEDCMWLVRIQIHRLIVKKCVSWLFSTGWKLAVWYLEESSWFILNYVWCLLQSLTGNSVESFIHHSEVTGLFLASGVVLLCVPVCSFLPDSADALTPKPGWGCLQKVACLWELTRQGECRAQFALSERFY